MAAEHRNTHADDMRALYECVAPSHGAHGTEFTLPLRLHGSARPQNVTLRVVEVYLPRPRADGQPVKGGTTRIVLVEVIQIDRRRVPNVARYVLKWLVDRNGESEIPMEAELCRRVHECIEARNAAGGARWDSTKMVDVFSSRGAHFMVQSVFVGLPLDEAVSLPSTAGSPWLVRDILVRVSEMLQHLQMKLRFIHRDLHCANVLVSNSTAAGGLRVCIIDFGMSLIKDPGGGPAYVGNPDTRIRPAYARIPLSPDDWLHHNPAYERTCLYRGRASLDLMCLCVSLLPMLYALSDFASRRLARMCTHAMKTLKPALQDAFWTHLRSTLVVPRVAWLMCYAHAACTSVRVFEPAVFSHLLRLPQQLYIERPVVGGTAVGAEGREVAKNNVLNIAEFLKQTPLTRGRYPGAELAWDALCRRGGELVTVTLANETPMGLYNRLVYDARALGCSVAVGYLDAHGNPSRASATRWLDHKVLIVLAQELPDLPGVAAGLYYLRIDTVDDSVAARKYDDPMHRKHGVQARYDFGDLWRNGLAVPCAWDGKRGGTLTVAYADYAGPVASGSGLDGLRLAPHAKCHEDEDDLTCLSRIPAGGDSGRLVNRMMRFVRTKCEGGFVMHARADAANSCFSMSYRPQVDIDAPLPITRIARIRGVVGVACWSTYAGGISPTECVFADDYDRLLRITAADTDASLRMESMILSHQDETALDAARRSKIDVVYRNSGDEGRINAAVYALIYKRDPVASTAAVVEIEDGDAIEEDDVVITGESRWRATLVDEPHPPPPRGRHSSSWTGAEATADEAAAEAAAEARPSSKSESWTQHATSTKRSRTPGDTQGEGSGRATRPWSGGIRHDASPALVLDDDDDLNV